MRALFSILVLTFVSSNTIADLTTEIEHLLNYVRSTNCLYERNGDLHSGEEAVAHINKKYAYFSDDIETAEDFIKYSATKSTLSGDCYKIHCDGLAPIASSQWLHEELLRYRNSTINP